LLGSRCHVVGRYTPRIGLAVELAKERMHDVVVVITTILVLV